VIHFHIPKCAGSALEAMLLQPMVEERGLRLFHHNDHAESFLCAAAPAAPAAAAFFFLPPAPSCNRSFRCATNDPRGSQ